MKLILLTLCLVAVSLMMAAPAFAQDCPPGQVQSADTAGNCCWPGQAWSGSRCVGEPTSCMEGFIVGDDGQSCELITCEEGRVRASDGIHCCWPGQGWSSSRGECVGVPDSCPDQYVVEDGECVEGPYLRDSDGDGVPDALDKCPYVPEPQDGYQNGDGCPNLDIDGDGIPNHLDNCPDQPMVFFPGAPTDGCPVLDRDGDGIPDVDDLCPDEPEDPENRGDQDADGCPDDDDGDGIPNVVDLCPGQPEDFDGIEDVDGCADLDNDGDGITDFSDDCPNLAADYIPGTQTDGCPLQDSDGDGVQDAFDLCPGKMEDGLGRFPNDGCPLPPNERFAVLFQSPPSFAIVSGIHFIPTPTETVKAYPIGIEYQGKRGVVGASLAFPPLGAMVAEGHMGVRILSWPNRDMTGFSLFNPTAGVHFTLNNHAEPLEEDFMVVGSGLWLRQSVFIGPVSVGLEYRGYQLFGFATEGFYDTEFRPESIYSVVFGWHFDL